MSYDLVTTINPSTSTLEMKCTGALSVPTAQTIVLSATSAPNLKLYKVVSLTVSYPKDTGGGLEFAGNGIYYEVLHRFNTCIKVFVKPGENIVLAKSIQPIYSSGYNLSHRASATGLVATWSYQEHT